MICMCQAAPSWTHIRNRQTIQKFRSAAPISRINITTCSPKWYKVTLSQGFLERFLNVLCKKDVFSLTTDVFLHPAQVCYLDVQNCNRDLHSLRSREKLALSTNLLNLWLSYFQKIRPWTNHGQTVESTLFSVESTLFSMERTLFSVELAPSKHHIFSFIFLDVRISAN